MSESGGRCKIRVVDQQGNPQAGVHVYINNPQLERWIEEWYRQGDRRNHSSSAEGTTRADGVVRFRIGCEGEFKIFLNRKSYGMYLLDDGVDITIRI